MSRLSNGTGATVQDCRGPGNASAWRGHAWALTPAPGRAALFGAQALSRFYALPSMAEALASDRAQRQKNAQPR